MARQLGEYLLGHDNQRQIIRDIYVSMPEKWKKELVRIIRNASDKMYEFLNSTEAVKD